ncbi:glycosyl hydrolase family 61-domain-containing protein [Mycena maculata]|uniref:lytic cellulose monooxygenase (C4-dehydrogenating) n=1 Tax=Mycena maculata TaxID=230809 RepID=A0AAD7HPZ6_9AGAR|nr:glycosyl hydrolase family 61-domain-containing protein [Mycena maculata]
MALPTGDNTTTPTSFLHSSTFFSLMRYLPLAAAILASTPLVSGHGQVNTVTSGTTVNAGPNQYWAGDAKNSKTATRVMYQASSPAYVLFDSYGDNSRMSCEGSAKSPAPTTISVAAGDYIEVYWEGATSELKGKAGTGSLTAYNPWVHAMGFVFDYITSCNGDCTTFDSTNAGWTKIAHAGIDMSQTISSDLRETMKNKPEQYYPTSGLGLWAMAKMVQNGSKWSIQIPSSLESGQYMIRHELAAVHNPKTNDPTTGPQLYIACIQLDVTGGGDTSLPAGTQAKSLYLPDGTFANTNVLSGSFNPANVPIPGPTIWDGVFDNARREADSTAKSTTKRSKRSHTRNHPSRL